LADGLFRRFTLLSELSKICRVPPLTRSDMPEAGLMCSPDDAGHGTVEARLRRAMRFIESHLAGDLSLERLASEACISPFHFHRLFSMVVAMPVAEYVRHVRLEAAAQQLRSTRFSVTAVARHVGYTSTDAFGRAFRSRFGETPSAYRRRWRTDPPPLLAAPELLFGAADNLGVELRRAPRRMLACVRNIGGYETVWKAWRWLDAWAMRHGLDPRAQERIGISYDDPELVAAHRIRYDACLAIPAHVDQRAVSDALIEWRELRSGDVAVAVHRGAYHLLGEAYRRLYVSWLPDSGWVPRDEPSVEVYLVAGAATDSKLVTEIQLPVSRTENHVDSDYRN
jgi:AraC family transcriptional regulator